MSTLFNLAAMLLYAGFAIGCAAETIGMVRQRNRFDAFIGSAMTALLALGCTVHAGFLMGVR